MRKNTHCMSLRSYYVFNIYKTPWSTIILVFKKSILFELSRMLWLLSELVSPLRAIIRLRKLDGDGIDQRFGQRPGLEKRCMQGRTGSGSDCSSFLSVTGCRWQEYGRGSIFLKKQLYLCHRYSILLALSIIAVSWP